MSSVLTQEREEIISENNTAQESLRGILEKLNRGSQILRIREALYGDLDFSILTEYGFENIQYIDIEKGKVTSITGLPKGLRGLTSAGNLLVEVRELPAALIDLNLEYNYLTSIDLSKQVQLEVLRVSHNQLTTIKNLPKSLATLKCDHNKLPRLDLRGLVRLDHLHVSNNPITIIENLPEGVSDFQMENTPGIEFRNSAIIPVPKGENVEIGTEIEQKDYKEALNIYFKFKNKYENELYDARREAHKEIFRWKTLLKSSPHTDTDNRKILKNYLKVANQKMLGIKPRCINCKRPVGTVFSQGKIDSRYTMTCGDPNPATRCKLDITIFNGEFSTLEYAVNLFKEEIDDLKDTIIHQKLDTLFNYVSEEESVKLFKTELQNYTETSEIYKNILNTYNHVYNNDQKKEQITKKLGEVFKLIEYNRELLAEYNKTQNTEILKTVMELQIKEIAPEIRNLRILKHEIMEMDSEYSGNSTQHKMVRHPITLEKMEFLTGEPPRVLKFSK
jgi:hypothetical protein